MSRLLSNPYTEFNFSLCWMMIFLPWPRAGNSVLGYSLGLLAVVIQSPFTEETAHFQRLLYLGNPSFSCQPLTSSRASSFLLTESLKPQLFPTGSPDMAAPGWCDGPMMLPGTQTPWIFLLHHPPAMTFTFLLHFKASHL